MIVSESDIDKLVVKYLGGAKENITSDERDILLVALFSESTARGGLAQRGMHAMEARLNAQKKKLPAPVETRSE